MNMAGNDNSVNMTSLRATYHYGDLRLALISEGLRLLETQTAQTLSLREVARNVGVSAPAVYRHFPDKAAFLRVLAGEGLARLAAFQAQASERAGPNAFAASGKAYVQFALANPALFRLVFTTGAGVTSLSGEREGSAGWQLHRHVVASIGTDADDEDVRVVAYRAWALVHGLAMLILDGQLDRANAEPLIARIIDGIEL